LKSFSWTLALRYLNPLRTFVSIITLISLLGVAFGAMVLIVVLSVHNGFERNLKETLLGFSPHVSVYANEGDGLIYDWAEAEESFAKAAGVESAYALVEGFVLLDSKLWQRPVRFRAINTDNEEQVGALREMLDLQNYPASQVDFDLAVGGAAEAVTATQDGDLSGVPAVNTRPIYGDKNVVISKVLAEGLRLKPGDEIRLIAASNLEAVMDVYRVPEERAWDLYPDVFQPFEEAVKTLFTLEGEEERAGSSELLEAYRLIQSLVPVEVETPNGPEMTEGKPMRAVERRRLGEILDLLYESEREEGGLSFYESGTQAELLERLRELRELDLEKADNEGFREIEEFVVPKTLVSQQFQLVKTEKVMMSFALSFITLLSAFSIMAVMYTVTVQKRQEIGVMKALGARPSQIVRVFVYQGLIVGVGGALLGLAMGLLAIHYREGIVTILRGLGIDPFPPEFHGMSELPALVEPPQLIVISVVAVILCLLAALVPALMAAFRDPAKSLRNL